MVLDHVHQVSIRDSTLKETVIPVTAISMLTKIMLIRNWFSLTKITHNSSKSQQDLMKTYNH